MRLVGVFIGTKLCSRCPLHDAILVCAPVQRFYLTDSVPTVVKFLPKNDVFHIVPLLPQILMDLDVHWGSSCACVLGRRAIYFTPCMRFNLCPTRPRSKAVEFVATTGFAGAVRCRLHCTVKATARRGSRTQVNGVGVCSTESQPGAAALAHMT